MLTLIVAALCGLANGEKAVAAVPDAAASKPNIIFVMPDDAGYGDYSIFGNPIIKTPAVDAFVKQGLLLTQFHVSPACAPTRAALMLGRHEFRSGVTHTIRLHMRIHHITPAMIALLFLVLCNGCSPQRRLGHPPTKKLFSDFMGPIDIRTKNGKPEFYDTLTGKRFIPRGVNYTWSGNSINGKKNGYHNVFDPIGDGNFQKRKEIYFAAIKDIAANKYNIIRVFLNADAMGPKGQKGPLDDPAPSINKDYINNIKEFLREAAKHDLRVTITSGARIPFQYIKTKPAGSTFHNMANTAKIRSAVNKIQFYIQQDLLESQMQYHGDLVKALLTDEDKSLRSAIFSYEPIQEYFIPKKNGGSKREDKYVYPWHLETFGPWPAKKNSTEIKPRTYKLKDNHDEQSALAENINYYHTEQIVKSIRKIEGAEKLPITFSGMVKVDHHGGDIIEDKLFWGFHLNYRVYQKLALKDGHMYADVHIYPSPLKVNRSGKRKSYPWNLDLALASIGLSRSEEPKLPFDLPEEWKRVEMKIPFVIGEFGARKPVHPKPSFNGVEKPLTPKRAGALLRDFQIQTCAFGFQGWYYWIYHDDGPDMAYQFFNPQDDKEINRALAPKYRPDPGK